jgi:hypothetical protein
MPEMMLLATVCSLPSDDGQDWRGVISTASVRHNLAIITPRQEVNA